MSDVPEVPRLREWEKLLLLSAFGLAITLVVWWPMIASYPATPGYDGRYFFHQIEIGKAAFRHYGELPLWNPFDCVGLPMWDYPEAITVSPITLLTLPLSTLSTYYVWNIVHAPVGFVGMWLLARRDFGLGLMGAFIASTLWAFGAWHACQSAGNHETFVTFYNVPLVLYLWRRAEQSWDAAVGAGLVLALMIYDGGSYPVPYTAVLLTIEALTRLDSLSRARRVIVRGLAVAGTAFALSACRLLPILDQLSRHKRVLPPDVDHILRWETLKTVFLYHGPDPLGTAPPNQQYGLDEYVIYIGPFGLAMAGVGLAIAAANERRRWTLFAGACVAVLALGQFASWAPWPLLRDHVFPFTAMRVACRFVLLVALFASLWMGLAAEALPSLVNRWIKREEILAPTCVVAVGLALLSVGGSVAWGSEVIAHRFREPPPLAVQASPRFYYGGPDLTPDWIDQPRQNRAYTGCRSYSFAFYQDAPVWTGDVPQARASDERAIVSDVVRTNNTFRLRANVKEPARVLLNSAFAHGWRSNVGTVVEDEHLLALDLPPGVHDVKLSYWPRTLSVGLLLSAATVLACGLFFARARIAKRLDRYRAERTASS